MPVGCANLTGTLIDSELFRTRQGAFTGADKDRIGRFEGVGRGTLLLDEIDSLPLEQQGKLLRVLETRCFEPLGSHKQKRSEGRLVVASNVDLNTKVRLGDFREDLYYRAERDADRGAGLAGTAGRTSSPLALDFVADFARNECGREPPPATPEFLACLEAYGWPGNLRELKNIVQKCVIMGAAPR